MRLRAKSRISHLGKIYEKDDLFDVGDYSALIVLQTKNVEPVFELQPYTPELPNQDCSLWDACKAFIEGYPPLQPFLVGGPPILRPRRIRVRDFAQLPQWEPPVDYSGRDEEGWRSVLFHDLDLSGLDILSQDPAPSAESSRAYWSARQYRSFLGHVAMHYFIRQLATTAWVAKGVFEGDLASLRLTDIPAGWWDRDITLDLARNEILEHTSSSSRHGVRRFSQVVVFMGDRTFRSPDTPDHTSKGRTSHRDTMLEAFDELLDLGRFTRQDLKSKMVVRGKVLDHLGLPDDAPGYHYKTFVKHVGPEIDEALKHYKS